MNKMSDGLNDKVDTGNELQVHCGKYDRNFPFFRQPGEIGSFSLDEQRQFHNDRSQLRSYCPPRDRERCKFDLRHGYREMIKKDESVPERIDNMLNWIMENKIRFIVKTNSLNEESTPDTRLFKCLSTDFVCWRGLLTRLMCLPYEKRDDLMLGVIKFRGTYFLCEFETEAKKVEKHQTTPRQEEMCAWGFKFEQYVTTGICEEQPVTSCPVNTNASFCSVVRSRLENHSLVYGAEVDCTEANSTNNYVELKTSRLIETQRQHENFCKFKLIKWWAQSFLIGILEVVCGFRDDDGIVRCLQTYPVKQMPVITKESIQYPWKPNVCFNFLKTFLDFVKQNVTEDDERTVYLFHSTPGKNIRYIKKTNDPEFTFLPQWFTSWDAWDKPA